MISKEQFLLRQPGMPDEKDTDQFYYGLSLDLVKIVRDKGLFPSYPEAVVERAALTLIGYYQDVICDAGIWRSFITECRRLYGYTLPFFLDKNEKLQGNTEKGSADEIYTDFELNRADVRFMVWYALSMNYENRRVCYPFDSEIIAGADAWYEKLESEYDEAPIPTDYRFSAELEIHSEEDRPEIMRLANWLFLHCYLMTPAFAMTLSELAGDYDLSTDQGIIEMQKRLDTAMWQDPTGPLALYLGEWLYLIVEGRPAPEPKSDSPQGEHKYYTAFTKFTEGKTMQFFASYQELNRFFIDALGWNDGEEHLPQVKQDSDFVLMVDPAKGMLLARNIAKCIAAPDNHLYDKNYAASHAIDLLTVRGMCPPDLLLRVCKNGWLPDAVFPGSDDTRLVAENRDFIARCYLQQYYRGD